MPLNRDTFLPQNLLTVYSSSSGMLDPRTNLPYVAGGLIVGTYMDVTEAEAQALSNNQCHEGRYRFVQIDSTATQANIKQGTVGFMKTLALGVNFITSADKALTINCRAAIFLQQPTSAQILAGCFLWVQESGDANVFTKTGLANGAPAIGDIINATANGLVDDPATQNWTGPSIGIATTAPVSAGLVRVFMEQAPIQG